MRISWAVFLFTLSGVSLARAQVNAPLGEDQAYQADPEHCFQASVEIARPAAEVFAYVEDASKSVEWSVYVHHITAQDPAHDGQVGSTRFCYRLANETGIRWQETVLSRDPGHSRVDLIHDIQGYFPPVANEARMLAEHTYEALGPRRTRLTFKTSLLAGSGVANQWFFELGKQQSLDFLTLCLENIKVVLEQGVRPHAYAPPFGDELDRMEVGFSVLQRVGMTGNPNTIALRIVDGPQNLARFSSQGTLTISRDLFERAQHPRVTELLRGPSEQHYQRLDLLERLAKDPTFRRPDGTLRWRRMLDKARSEAGGLLHFGMSMFLKEVVTVTRTGDRARIGEFFDALTSTDFLINYAAVGLGARAGGAAYSRFIGRYMKPGFVNGLLRQNVMLTAGLALPEIVAATANGTLGTNSRTLAISVASLGLSAGLVTTSAEMIPWVRRLDAGRDVQRLTNIARTGASVGKLARLGGLTYQVVELTVILLLSDWVDDTLTRQLDLNNERKKIARAGLAFVAAVGARHDDATLEQAAQTYHEAWNDYRAFLYRDLELEEARFAGRIAKAARKAKENADVQLGIASKLPPAVVQNILQRHKTLEAYALSLTEAKSKGISASVDDAMRYYERRRGELIEEIYRGRLRDGAYLPSGIPPAAFEGDTHARGELGDQLYEASLNRIQSYQDELEVLDAARAWIAASGGADAALGAAGKLVERTRDMDRDLFLGAGSQDAQGGMKDQVAAH